MRQRLVVLKRSVLLGLTIGVGLLVALQISQFSASAKEVTLTFMTQWQRAVMEDIVQEFQETHPGIKIKLLHEGWAAYGTALPKLLTMAAGGVMPDVLEVRHDLYYPLADAGLLYDLSAFYNRDASKLKGYWGPAIVEGARLNGRLMQIPYYGLEGEMWAITYSRDVFNEAGLIEPSQLVAQKRWNWDSFIQAAEKLTKAQSGKIDRVGVYTMSALNGGFESWLWSFGGGVLNDAGDKCILDSPASINALKFMSSMVNKNVFSFGAGLGPYAEIWKAPKFAMAAWWSSVSGTIIGAGAKWAMEQVPFPAGPVNAVNIPVNIHGLGISSATRYPEEAWEFCKFVLEKKGPYTNIGFILIEKPTMYRYVAEVLPRARPQTRYLNQTEIFNAVHGELGKIWNQQASPEAAAAEAARQCNEVLKKGKK